MSKRAFLWLSLLLVLAMVLVACAPADQGTPPGELPETGETAAPGETLTETEGITPTEEVTGTEAAPTEEGEAGAPSGEPVSFTFWSAPNPPQEVFWSNMAEAYMAENPNVSITVQAMPEAPTSEAGIQAALAGGSAPAASENIFIGFGSELQRSQALVPLNEFDGWEDLIAGRNMADTITGWEFEDGNFYILPLYSNAILWGWRTDILQEMGISEPPRTYSEILALGEQLQADGRYFWARPALAENTWFERWFDFFILYDAASNGQPLITGNEITADDDAAITVLQFLRDLSDNNLLLTQEAPDAMETGIAVASQLGPWTFTAWRERFPELVYNETFTLTPPPVPDDHTGDQVNTFADAKGVVIYAQVPEEQQQAAFDFLQWVFSLPENDLALLEATSLPPARDDLATNEAFQNYFAENPELVPYAENLPNAVPPFSHPEFTEIQVRLGDEAVNPVVAGQKEPEQAWNDFKASIEDLLQ